MSVAFLKWVPVVDEDLCTGCAACVEACGPKSLEILDRVAVLVRPDTCGSEEHCIAPCPTTAIQMAWVELNGDKTRGKWRDETSPLGRQGPQARKKERSMSNWDPVTDDCNTADRA